MLRRTIPLHLVLLLVALFNALVGMPLHEARHIREAAASAGWSAAQSCADEYSDSAPDTESGGAERATCAWCQTHALDAGLAHALAIGTPLIVQRATVAPLRTVTFTQQQVRWPFSARDPPVASRA